MKIHAKLARSALAKPITPGLPKDPSWTNVSDQRVYQLLQECGPLSRDALVERTGIPRTTVYDALMRLSLRGLITRFKEPRQTRGRRRVYFRVVG